MKPAHLFALWQAETNKLLSRMSARAGLVAATAIGLLVPLFLYWLAHSDMSMNGAEVSDTLAASAPKAISWSLNVRNFFILRAFIIMLGAVSVAGEFRAKTLREDLLRPIPRWSLLLAKWAALNTWIALSLGMTWVLSSILGVLLFGVEGGWTDPALAYLVTGLCDVGFAALVLAMAVAIRSVAATIIGVFLFLVFDTFLGWGLTLLSWIGGMTELPWVLDFAVQARPWLPSSAFGLWVSFAGGDPWVWQSAAALGAVTALSAVIATAVFERIDLP
jgi:ABC-type transport system involved in multi-copper enzyme maturation permease subunit